MTSRTLYHENKEIIEWQWSSNSELMPEPFWTSCYLVDGLLIDSGSPGSVDELREFLSSKIESNKINKCLLTHAHEDHSGGAYMLKEEFDIPVYSSEKTHQIMREGFTYPDYRKMTWGEKLHPVKTEVIKNSITSGNGKYEFTLLNTPGHAPGLITLIENQQEWIFATDAIQPKYVMIFGESTNIHENIQKIHESLIALYDYTEGFKNPTIFMAGKDLVTGRELIRDRIQELEKKHRIAHQYYSEFEEEGYSQKRSMKKVVKKMFGNEHFIGKFTRGGLASYNLVKSLLEWPLEKENS
ncbi:MAG: MBL fold metallo-hydrolase [Promethearchaeia archaeon]